MEHDWDMQLAWCRRCGKPKLEILDYGPHECDGLQGVVHARYQFARARADRMFGPVVDALTPRAS